MPEYEKDTLFGQAIAILMSLCASAIIVAATIKLIMWIL